MESQRSFLLIALAVVTFLLFQQWQLENAPAPVQQPQVVADTHQAPQSDSSEFIPQSSETANTVNQSKATTGKLITLSSDTLEVVINTQGGDVVSAKLLDFETEQNNGVPFPILTTDGFTYVAQSGLIGSQGPDSKATGRPIYFAESNNYSLIESQDQVTANLSLIEEDGVSVIKSFSLKRGSHQIDVNYQVTNNLAHDASVQLYGQLKQSSYVESGSSMMMPTYRGAAYSSVEKRFEKYDFDDIASANLKLTTEGGWVAMLQHYFVSAWVPSANENNQLYTRMVQGDQAVIGYKAPLKTIAPGATENISASLYVGPKDQDALEALAPNLSLTVDYGFLWMISQPLFWLLVKIQALVSNWGVAIIVITLIVKGLMYPLTKAQYTSMAKMRKLQPKMQALKERFGDDRQKMGQATMELYRKEKVNPAGGCFPLLLQMPIFLALYWVFVESVELRHAPFALWINDLSAKDPYFILPILMGASMWLMQKMQPMTIQDPMQQKVMQFMPVMMTVFFLWFPSGLVLYWLISNVITMIQMKIIFAGIDKQEALEKANKKKS
jgi:YidC/Oxa1 family membrane protein insertase